MTGVTLDLTPHQRAELRRYVHGALFTEKRPNKNLIRRNMLTRAHEAGYGFYRITPFGLEALRTGLVAGGTEMTLEELWPRVPEYRYRVYAVRGTGPTEEREVLAAAPDGAGVGTALLTIHEDQKALGRRLADHGRIGVLDVLAGGPAGEWIVLPWDRRR